MSAATTTQPGQTVIIRQIDAQFAAFLKHLHRGGTFGYWWTVAGKLATWWPVGAPPPPPTNTDIYFGIHPTAAKGTRAQRSTIATVCAINCLFGEFDAKDFGGDLAACLAYVKALTPAPSVVICSGGGYHAYWLLREPFALATGADRQRARQLQAAWVKRVGSDDGAKDLARVLRVPGTLNAKYTPARQVAIEWCDMARLYDLAQLAALVKVTTRPAATKPNGHAEKYVAAALESECQRVRSSSNGNRNTNLNTAAFNLGQLVGGGALSQSEVEGVLHQAAASVGLPESEIYATIASGLKAGLAQPREIPEPRTSSNRHRHDHAATTSAKAADAADEDAEKKQSQGTVLTEIAQREYTFFHDANGVPFAIVKVNGYPEVIPLRTTEFRALLAARFSELCNSTPGTRGVEESVRVLTKIALYDAPEREVFTRVGKHGRSIILDLGNDARECIVITSAGWRIEAESPVLFRHARGMQALPTPTGGGGLADLAHVINVTEQGLRLLLAWLAFALNPDGPYPLLVLRAQQGAAKSCATRFVKLLLDPSNTPPRAEPRDTRDLMIATRSNWIVAFDNLSNLPDWLSDALCRLATGGGFGTRQLYEDDTETTFVAKRPVVLNSIGDASTRGDFLSRALILDLPAISEEQRTDEKEINARFEAMRPALLGALLDAAAAALARVDSIKIVRLPRMADFAKWSAAAEQELGFAAGGFMAAYNAEQEAAGAIAVDSSLVAKVLQDWLDWREHFDAPLVGWSGKAGALYHELHHYAEEYGSKAAAQNLPKSPGWLSNELRRLVPALRECGIGIDFSHHGRNGTNVGIKRVTEKCDAM